MKMMKHKCNRVAAKNISILKSGENKMSKEERPVQIIADHTINSQRIYSNYVQVSVSPIDCTLTFCDVIGPQSEEEALKMQKTGVLPAPVKAVIAIPTQIIDGLIQALQAQRDKQIGEGKPSSGTTVQ
jgi:hypothetical protein